MELIQAARTCSPGLYLYGSVINSWETLVTLLNLHILDILGLLGLFKKNKNL